MMNFYEKTFMVVVSLSMVASLQMLINVPDNDIPDIKDVHFLFPNLSPAPEAYEWQS